MNQAVCFDRIVGGAGASVQGATQGQCHDISEGGLNLQTDSALLVGEVLRIYLPLPGGLSSVPVTAEVRWTLAMDGGFSSGLQFLA
jgi:PilZ domain